MGYSYSGKKFEKVFLKKGEKIIKKAAF